MNRISFLGDIYLDKEYKLEFKLDEYIFNLEYPISKRGIPLKNKINLINSKSYIEETFGKFPLAVNLANNHIMDYGEEAFHDTLIFLEKNGIKYFGAGNNENNYNNPCLVTFNEKTIALFGYSCESTNAHFGSDNNNGSAKLDINLIKKDLKNCNSDFKIVQLHWGEEDIPYPKYEDVLKAHEIIDSGADLIIGHHAHRIQSKEKYNNKNIYYGLGNFIFPSFKLDSYYNGYNFTKISKKTQLSFNNKSLIVNIDREFKINYKVVFCKDNNVKLINNYNFPTFIPKNKIEFLIKYKKDKKLMMLRNFFLYPKVPTIRHLKKFFGIGDN